MTVSGRDIYTGVVFTLFTLIMALRAKCVGVDTAPYSRIFTKIAGYETFFGAFENTSVSAPLYVLFCRILSYITTDVQILTVFSALFINIGLLVFIRRTSEDYAGSFLAWIGLTLFYCSMNGSRQCMALVLVMNALWYFSKDVRSLHGWLLWLLSLGIHPTAVVTAPVILGIALIKKGVPLRKMFFWACAAGAGFSFGFRLVVPLLIKLIPGYAMYTSSDASFSIYNGTGGGRIVFLYLFLMCIALLWMYASGDEDERDFSTMLMPAVVFGLMLGILNCRNELVNRLIWYYLALMLPFIPATAKKYEGWARPVIEYGSIAVLLAYSMLSLMENQNGVTPYVFFWTFI